MYLSCTATSRNWTDYFFIGILIRFLLVVFNLRLKRACTAAMRWSADEEVPQNRGGYMVQADVLQDAFGGQAAIQEGDR
jgi:hypothetical protein